MCGANISMGLNIASVLMQTGAAVGQSRAAKAAYDYQAQVAENNRRLAEMQAEDALERGRIKEQEHRRKVLRFKGRQIASLAARGVDLRSGSPLDILAGTDVMGEYDAQMILANAEREAWARRIEANNYAANAGLLRARASAERPLLRGASTLLTGAGVVADRWYRFKKVGAV